MTNHDRRTVTVEEAARIIGISRTTAYECIRNGSIPSVRYGRRILIPLALLDQSLGLRSSPDTPILGPQSPIDAGLSSGAANRRTKP